MSKEFPEANEISGDAMRADHPMWQFIAWAAMIQDAVKDLPPPPPPPPLPPAPPRPPLKSRAPHPRPVPPKDYFWFAVAPEDVATAQWYYDRRRLVLRMRKVGLTYKQIAERMGYSKNYIAYYLYAAERELKRAPTPPVVKYFQDGQDICDLVWLAIRNKQWQ